MKPNPATRTFATHRWMPCLAALRMPPAVNPTRRPTASNGLTIDIENRRDDVFGREKALVAVDRPRAKPKGIRVVQQHVAHGSGERTRILRRHECSALVAERLDAAADSGCDDRDAQAHRFED